VNERLVPDLARAVLDGTPIDWAGADSGADEASRPVIAELRVVAALAEVHRRLPLHDQAVTPGDRADTLPDWGHLRALERIGRGAFGEVYRAWDTRLDREVALKLIDADPTVGDEASSSIIHEGRLLARVRHPNVVTIYGAEQIGARIGLWMEFVRGRTLKQIVDAGKVFGGADAVQIGLDIARAVAAVHSAGVLHRDIKAQNVILADEGRAVLMDFGTGREFADNGSADVAGTPLYLAPEILSGGDATVQSDIYSLGVVLYYLVTGSYPVPAQTVSDLRLAHQRHERVRIRTARRGSALSPKLARIIERAIDQRPASRYASADALAADLATLQRRPRLPMLLSAIAAAAVLLLIAGVGWETVGRRLGSSRTPGALLARLAGRNADAGHVIPSQPIVAVLPFENLSDEPGSGDFVDGLTDELIRNLGTVQGLHVRSRDSSFTFKDKPRDIAAVGQQLGVNLVVEGSILRSGNRLHVNAELIQVAGDVRLWSDRFARDLEDIFVIQDDISRAIVHRLRLTPGREQRRYDTNVETYELYLKGSALVGRRGADNLEQAGEVFKQVLARDPDFAPAYARLAIAHALDAVPSGSPISFVEAQSIIRTAAGKALDLDSTLAEAYEAMGWVHARELDWLSAEKAFKRAIDLNPNLSQTYTSYSTSTLRPLGRRDEALRLLREALKNDPLSVQVQQEIGQVQLESGQYEEAVSAFERVRAIESDFPFLGTLLGRALVFAERPTEALSVFERTEPHRPRGPHQKPRANPRMVLAYLGLGMRAEAEALAAEHADQPPSTLAIIYAALGDKDRAFGALERTAFVEPQRLPLLLAYPEIAVPLRGDPRLASLRQRFHLPPQ
jgi:serine/threonine-protein kinase